jgi:hypothetical protein
LRIKTKRSGNEKRREKQTLTRNLILSIHKSILIRSIDGGRIVDRLNDNDEFDWF